MIRALVGTWGVVCSILFCTPSTSAQIVLPLVTIQVEGDADPISVPLWDLDEGGKITHIIGNPGQHGFFVTDPGNWQINIAGVLDPDPSIAYDIEVTNFTPDPLTFTFGFSTSIDPTAPQTIIHASLVGGLTDFTGDGVSITPAPFPGATIQTAVAGFPGDLTPVFLLDIPVGPAFSASPGSPGSVFAYGPFVNGPKALESGGFFNFSVGSQFTLSGNGDVVALTGFAKIVPEPSTWALAMTAAGALVAFVLRRRRRGA